VEYDYADDVATAGSEDSVALTPASLAGWSTDLVRSMRDAVITADLDALLAAIQEGEAHDPQSARGLRRLAEGFQYQNLLDLLTLGAAGEAGQV
jgi:hypothetical protein